MRFSRPRAIREDDAFGEFDCGEQTLDHWIKARAVRNERSNASRTFVTVESESGLVAGYYCLSASSLTRERSQGSLGDGLPNPIPVILIGRLAVDRRFQGAGVGVSLLQDATIKAIEASRLVGSRAVLVDALSESAERFYRKHGFGLIPNSERVMYLLTQDAIATVASLTQ